MTNLCYDILSLNSTIVRLVSSLPPIAIQQYQKKCLIDEIVITNEIEGVHSSRKEIGEALSVLEEQSSNRRKRNRFIGIVNSYYKLMGSNTIELNTPQDVRNLYDEVILEEVMNENKKNKPDGAVFRAESVEVKSATGKVIHKGLYPEAKIIDSMEKALAFMNSDETKLLYRLCLFHYLFEFIHPFYDGNGRLGRLIVSYELAKVLEPFTSFRISEKIGEHIKGYYEVFSICNDPRNMSDLTPFLIFMLNIIKESETDLIDALSRKEKELDRYFGRYRDLFDVSDKHIFELYSLLLQAALFSEIGISTNDLLIGLNCSRSTLNNRLSYIESKQILITRKSGKTKCYELDLKTIDSLFLNY